MNQTPTTGEQPAGTAPRTAVRKRACRARVAEAVARLLLAALFALAWRTPSARADVVPTPTPSDVPTPTDTPTPSPTPVDTATPTPVPTDTPSPTPTPIPSPTATPTPTIAVDPLCGSTVSGALVLDHDVATCPGFGIKVVGAGSLDCAGHTITGAGGSSGVQIDHASGAQVRNCRVTGFVRGIRFIAGDSNSAIGNESFGNSSYGIELAGASSGNLISLNLVRDNGDEGIHVGASATGNQIDSNYVLRSVHENLYFINCSGNSATGNFLDSSGAAEIFVKHSSNNTIADNRLTGGLAQVRGSSAGNVFLRNQLVGQGYRFEAYNDPALGWTFPHGNIVDGGSISQAPVCFDFEGAYDNHASHVIIDRCTPVTSASVGGQDPVGNTADLCGDGIVSGDEACDLGASLNGSAAACCTQACALVPSGNVCRAAAGECDVAETCDGISGACPANAFKSSGAPCSDDGKICSADVCDDAGTCTHPPGNAGVVCRPAAGACDVPEVCNGTSRNCPTDKLATAGTICRPSAGACDVVETCDGTSAACPSDTLRPAGTVCRASAGPCDVAELCSGRSALCPSDTFLGSTTICRPASGACDVAETCTGTSAACPADGLRPSGFVCRPSAGDCDVAETCSGTSADCPPDALLGPNTTCRAAAGLCDVAETCTGSSPSCPADVLRPSGFACRPANGSCDRAETCSGSSPACPADGSLPDGTPCDDGDACTTGGVCRSGACSGTPVACDLCETCDPALGCVAGPRADCALPDHATSKLRLIDRQAAGRDGLNWKWAGGGIAPRTLGDPTAGDRFAFCVWDGSSGSDPVLRLDVPPNAACTGGTCWSQTTDGFSYRSSDGAPNGATSLAVRVDAGGRGKVKLHGTGLHLALPALPLPAPVNVQLQSSAGACWQADYSEPGRNGTKQFRATD